MNEANKDQKPKSLKDLRRKSHLIAPRALYYLKLYVAGRLPVSNGDGWRVLRQFKLVKQNIFEFTLLGDAVVKELRDEREAKRTKAEQSKPRTEPRTRRRNGNHSGD